MKEILLIFIPTLTLVPPAVAAALGTWSARKARALRVRLASTSTGRVNSGDDQTGSEPSRV